MRCRRERADESTGVLLNAGGQIENQRVPPTMKTAITGQSVIVLLSAALLTGCGSNSPPGWGVRTVDWSQLTADKPTVPGIDRAAVRIGLYANSPVLVVWSDGQGGGFNASWDRTRNAVHYEARSHRGEYGTSPSIAIRAMGRQDQ